MTNKLPTTRMVDCANENALAMNSELPEIVRTSFSICWFYNWGFWLLLPPRPQDLRLELEFCSDLGIQVDLRRFKTKAEFFFWFSVIWRYSLAPKSINYNHLRLPYICISFTSFSRLRLSIDATLAWYKSRPRKYFKGKSPFRKKM